jgi:hypothetical protein
LVPPNGGPSIPAAHPRFLLYPAGNLTRATAYWNAAGRPALGADLNQAQYYACTGDATSLANVKAALWNLDPSNTASTLFPHNLGFFPLWAYQGTIGQPSFVPVGPLAVGFQGSSGALDQYRWNDWVPWAVDNIWNGLTAGEKTNALNDYTATWLVADGHHGQTVTVPSYTSLAKWWRAQAMTSAPDQVSGNYYTGAFRNELSWAITVCHEDDAAFNDLYGYAMGPTNSRWTAMVANQTTGFSAGGVPVEGSQYGEYQYAYPDVPFYTLAQMGRNPYAESPYYLDALYFLLYATSVNKVVTRSQGTVYTIPGYGTYDFVAPPAVLARLPQYKASHALVMALVNAGTVHEKYARQLIAEITGDLAGAAPFAYLASVDPGGPSRNWRLDLGGSLPLFKRRVGADYNSILTGGGGTDAQVFVQLGFPGFDSGQGYFNQGSGHSDNDAGQFQINRGDRWLVTCQGGYGDLVANVRVPFTVAGSPSPTTATFRATNLPTTSGWAGTGWKVKFTGNVTGALAGVVKPVSSYASTMDVTLSSALSTAPAAGDTGFIYNDTSQATTTSGPGRNNLYLGGYPPCPIQYAGLPVTKVCDDQTASGYVYQVTDLSTWYKGGNAVGHPERDNPWANTVIRELIWLYELQCMVVADHVKLNTVSGNSAFPNWSATNAQVAQFFGAENGSTPSVDGAQKATWTAGSHAARVITLWPSSGVVYNVVNNGDFPSPPHGASFYVPRLEITDTNTGSDTHHIVTVVQVRGSVEADVTASVADHGMTLEVDLSAPGKGSAVVTVKKDLSRAEGTVTVASEPKGRPVSSSGAARPPRAPNR